MTVLHKAPQTMQPLKIMSLEKNKSLPEERRMTGLTGYSYLNIWKKLRQCDESGREMIGDNKELHRIVIKDIVCNVVGDHMKVSISLSEQGLERKSVF